MICIAPVCVNLYSNKSLDICYSLHGDRSDLYCCHIDNHVEPDMASPFALQPPVPLDIPDANVADNWKKFTRAWTNYSLAIELKLNKHQN